MKKTTIRAAALALTAIFSAGNAVAGGTATIESVAQGPMNSGLQTTRTKLEWRDRMNLRIDTGEEASYLLVHKGEAYTIMEEGGAVRVVELAAMRQMMQSAGGKGLQGDTFGSVDAVEATGASEEVAGFTGKVYQVTTTDGSGKTSVEEWVVTDDPLVREMTHAYYHAVTAMFGDADDENSLTRWKDRFPEGYTGILKVAGRYRVVAVSSDTPATEHFALPAPPVDMGKFLGGR